MTRALVTQLVEALEGLANTHQQGRSVAAEGAFGYVEMHVQNAEGAITAAREYLANEPKSERAELIANLRSQECCQAHGGAGSHHTRCKECPRNVGDMLEADADLRTQLARRRVERDMAISMIGDCIDEQQATPYGWMVSGVPSVMSGSLAQEIQEQEAKRIGGTCKAFPVYTSPQQAAISLKDKPTDWSAA